VPSALVVGGAGPTGRQVVAGLVARGFTVSVFHTGRHEVDHGAHVRHIHGDPHFPETIAEALGTLEFDVVIAQYGRLRLLVDFFRGRTGHFVAIGSATRIIANAESTTWGPLGRPGVMSGSWLDPSGSRFENDDSQKLSMRVVDSFRLLFEAHAQGDFDATYLGYPIVYGPFQPGCREWSVVRRILDRRPTFILADGGLKLESRAFTDNAAAAPLLAVDRRDVSAGRAYVVADEHVFTQRQRVQFMADYLGHEWQVIDLPYEVATPCHPFFGHSPAHRVITSEPVRTELGYTDAVSAERALERTVDWLSRMEPAVRSELEDQLGDPFDYAKEDEIAGTWESTRRDFDRIGYQVAGYRHPYRHPKQAERIS
jgi:nucleoside-diphosphate-sugar epimerase